MIAINVVLLILALVCFLIAAIAGHAGATADGRPVAWTRTNFVALGLAFWVATLIIAVLVR